MTKLSQIFLYPVLKKVLEYRIMGQITQLYLKIMHPLVRAKKLLTKR